VNTCVFVHGVVVVDVSTVRHYPAKGNEPESAARDIHIVQENGTASQVTLFGRAAEHLELPHEAAFQRMTDADLVAEIERRGGLRKIGYTSATIEDAATAR
jgi:hypothetical protein